MSDMGDMAIRFEEDNWDKLIENFMDKYRDLWEKFVDEKFQDYLADLPEPDREENK